MKLSEKGFISVNGDVIFLNQLDKLSQPMAGSMLYDYDLKEANLFSLEIKEPFRRQGFATKLRDVVINKILNKGIKVITTSPKSYSDDFQTEDLIKFYIKDFYRCGAKEVIRENSLQIKLKAIF